jgi:hypothetical protein
VDRVVRPDEADDDAPRLCGAVFDPVFARGCRHDERLRARVRLVDVPDVVGACAVDAVYRRDPAQLELLERREVDTARAHRAQRVAVLEDPATACAARPLGMGQPKGVTELVHECVVVEDTAILRHEDLASDAEPGDVARALGEDVDDAAICADVVAGGRGRVLCAIADGPEHRS